MKIDFSGLIELGFSKLTVACYGSLFYLGLSRVCDLQRHLGRHRSGIYKTLGELEKKGFVKAVKSAGSPAYYVALPLDEALDSFNEYCRMELRNPIKQQLALLRERKRTNG